RSFLTNNEKLKTMECASRGFEGVINFQFLKPRDPSDCVLRMTKESVILSASEESHAIQNKVYSYISEGSFTACLMVGRRSG
ncbi:MAG TPA: hypothetical protein PLB74_00570, partial [Candidatus Paceibacterota bacterium]|nr:hypothetical protein [Candidatus Paceibacterota bacterium]